jgi:hypothetical protein
MKAHVPMLLAAAALWLVSACETMLPTEGASPPANLLEQDSGNNDGPSGGGMGGGGGY